MSLIDKEVITEIANQLAIPVSEIYGLYVAAQPVIGLLNIVGIIVWVVSTIAVAYVLNKKIEEDYNKSFEVFMGTVIISLGIGFVLILVIETLTMILLPEYAAVESLLHVLGGN